MDLLAGPYGNLLVPGALALVLLVVVLRVVRTIVRIVGLVALIAVLVSGYTLYSRITAIQQAAAAATHMPHSGTLTAGAIAGAVTPPARQALVEAGLDPTMLRVTVVCAGPQTRVELRYVDHGFPYSLLSQQTYTVPRSGNVRC